MAFFPQWNIKEDILRKVSVPFLLTMAVNSHHSCFVTKTFQNMNFCVPKKEKVYETTWWHVNDRINVLLFFVNCSISTTCPKNTASAHPEKHSWRIGVYSLLNDYTLSWITNVFWFMSTFFINTLELRVMTFPSAVKHSNHLSGHFMLYNMFFLRLTQHLWFTLLQTCNIPYLA